MWSKLRFSIITTTICWMPDSAGVGKVDESARMCLPSSDPATTAAEVPAAPRKKSLRFTDKV
jgi:hypothetical protein